MDDQLLLIDQPATAPSDVDTTSHRLSAAARRRGLAGVALARAALAEARRRRGDDTATVRS